MQKILMTWTRRKTVQSYHQCLVELCCIINQCLEAIISVTRWKIRGVIQQAAGYNCITRTGWSRTSTSLFPIENTVTSSAYADKAVPGCWVIPGMEKPVSLTRSKQFNGSIARQFSWHKIWQPCLIPLNCDRPTQSTFTIHEAPAYSKPTIDKKTLTVPNKYWWSTQSKVFSWSRESRPTFTSDSLQTIHHTQ